MIKIISKDAHTQEFNPKIVALAPGLEPYDPKQEIVFKDVITGDFLKAFHAFYDSKNYDDTQMKVAKPIKSQDLNTFPFMKTFIEKAIEEKSIEPLIPFLQGAYLLKAQHFQDVVLHSIATVVYFQGQSDYDTKQFYKNWNIENAPSTNTIQDVFLSKLQSKYRAALETKEAEKKEPDMFDQEPFEEWE